MSGEQFLEAVTARLLESDALTGDSEGTPVEYTVAAENVEYLVRTVLGAAADVAEEVRDAEEEWDLDEYAAELGYAGWELVIAAARPVETVHLPGDAPERVRCPYPCFDGAHRCDLYRGHDGSHAWGSGPFARPVDVEVAP